jgi:hypothetical protein
MIALSELVGSNSRLLKFSVPVVPDVLSKNIGTAASWLASKTTLKVKIELACQLLLNELDVEDFTLRKTFFPHTYQRVTTGTPKAKAGAYYRAVAVVPHAKNKFLYTLFNNIKQLNKKALNISDCDDEALNSYKMSPQERFGILRLITGIHIYDSKAHFVFIEGNLEDLMIVFKLVDGIKLLIPEPKKHSFPYRLWLELEPKIIHLKLMENLNTILGRSATYTTRGISPIGFKGLQTLYEVFYVFNKVNVHN